MPDTDQTIQGVAEPDVDGLLRANSERAFNARDAGKRAAALAERFVDEPEMYEPTGIVREREAIAAVAETLLEQFGPTFHFAPTGKAVGDHGLGLRLAAVAGEPAG